MTSVYVNSEGVAGDRWFPSSLSGATVTVEPLPEIVATVPEPWEWDAS